MKIPRFKPLNLTLLIAVNVVGFFALSVPPAMAGSAYLPDPVPDPEPLRFCEDAVGPNKMECAGSTLLDQCDVVQTSTNGWPCCEKWINDENSCCQRSCLTFQCV